MSELEVDSFNLSYIEVNLTVSSLKNRQMHQIDVQ